MYYIGLDVHKKTISYCVKDAAGCVHQEGKVNSTRSELDGWIRTVPQPRTTAMEATIFTGWIYDHLQPHASAIKVAHPLMLRAIAAAKKKNDKIDASKLADCLRCDFLPECHMASTEIRDRRRILRYRHLVVKQMVQTKNRVSGLLMETGVEHNKSRLHKVGYFPQTDGGEQRDRGQHPAAAPAQPGGHRALPEDRLCAGQFAGAWSAAKGEDQAAENRSGSRSDHRTELGSGDGGHHTVPLHQTGGELLRAVWRRAQLGGQGDAHAAFETTQQTYPACAGGGCEAGAAAERGTGSDPSEGDREGQQEQSHAGCCSQNGGLAAGRGSGEPRVYSRRAAGDPGSLKPAR